MRRVASQLHKKVRLTLRYGLHTGEGSQTLHFRLDPVNQGRIGAIPFRGRSAHRVEGHQLF